MVNDKHNVNVEVDDRFNERFCLGSVLGRKPINYTARRIQRWKDRCHDFLKRLNRTLSFRILSLDQQLLKMKLVLKLLKIVVKFLLHSVCELTDLLAEELLCNKFGFSMEIRNRFFMKAV
jgi:hypothetical protein